MWCITLGCIVLLILFLTIFFKKNFKLVISFAILPITFMVLMNSVYYAFLFSSK